MERDSGVIVLDTHALHWAASQPELLSKAAAEAIGTEDVLAVSAISWFELAWLVRRERLVITVPLGSWLQQLSSQVRTLGITPAIAEAAAMLPLTFPRDPADRLIYATAVEHGCRLVTVDSEIRRHPSAQPVALW